MKIGESIVNSINNGFRNCKFSGRDAENIKNTLNIPVHGSDTIHLIPHVPEVKVENVDDLHDKLSLLYDDYKVEGVVTWRKSQNEKQFVFVNYAVQ